MIHASKNLNSIQDTSGRIPEDMPCFIILGSDILAQKVIKFWVDEYRKENGIEESAQEVECHIQLFDKWQKEHPAKVPDLPSKPKGQFSIKIINHPDWTYQLFDGFILECRKLFSNSTIPKEDIIIDARRVKFSFENPDSHTGYFEVDGYILGGTLVVTKIVS